MDIDSQSDLGLLHDHHLGGRAMIASDHFFTEMG